MDLGTNAHSLESTTPPSETDAFKKKVWDVNRNVDHISDIPVSSMPPPYFSLVFTLRGCRWKEYEIVGKGKDRWRDDEM